MKGTSQLVDAIHHLKCAYEYMTGFIRDRPGTNAERIGKNYSSRIEWIFKDLVSNPNFPEPVRYGIRKEWESDSFAIQAITEKISLLLPEQRESIENIVDEILAGRTIKIYKNEGDSDDATD